MRKNHFKSEPQTFFLDLEDIKEQEEDEGGRKKINSIGIIAAGALHIGFPKTLRGLSQQMNPDRIDHTQKADEQEGEAYGAAKRNKNPVGDFHVIFDHFRGSVKMERQGR